MPLPSLRTSGFAPFQQNGCSGRFRQIWIRSLLARCPKKIERAASCFRMKSSGLRYGFFAEKLNYTPDRDSSLSHLKTTYHNYLADLFAEAVELAKTSEE